jgi:hypothetical protein
MARLNSKLLIGVKAMKNRTEPKKDTGGANVEVSALEFLDPSKPNPVIEEKDRNLKPKGEKVSKSALDRGQAAILSPAAERALHEATEGEKKKQDAEKS